MLEMVTKTLSRPPPLPPDLAAKVTRLPEAASGLKAKSARRSAPKTAVSLQPPLRAEPDFGPELRLAEPDKKPREKKSRRLRRQGLPKAPPEPVTVIEKEFRPDPEATDRIELVRGGRVRDPLRKMWKAREITKRQFDVVEDWRDDWALANGARVHGDNAGIRSLIPGRNWPEDTQIDALRRVQALEAGLSELHKRLFRWSVIEQRSLTAFVRAEGTRNETGGKVLKQLLVLLVEARP